MIAEPIWKDGSSVVAHVFTLDGKPTALVPVPLIVRENTTYLSMIEIKEDDE